ncbi:hypothetical protein [Oscillatoria sp. HE19RPO]|uniref:hypothetical protein n=1 Tax=Oscillatoria sp. HE19RPO TaxID=2954806 RepID=UPI0020C1C69F|nr:hypothetical protein [Oscillatoria sp. HE19RPO]
MNNQPYDALNRLAMRLHQTQGTDGPATEAEVAQIAAAYLNTLVENLSDRELVQAIDEYRSGHTRIKQVQESVQKWLETDLGHRQEQEFKEFIAQLNSRMGNVI